MRSLVVVAVLALLTESCGCGERRASTQDAGRDGDAGDADVDSDTDTDTDTDADTDSDADGGCVPRPACRCPGPVAWHEEVLKGCGEGCRVLSNSGGEGGVSVTAEHVAIERGRDIVVIDRRTTCYRELGVGGDVAAPRCWFPALLADTVYYSCRKERGVDEAIYRYPLPDGPESIIPDSQVAGEDRNGAVDTVEAAGDWVAWQWSNGGGLPQDVYAYRVSTAEVQQATFRGFTIWGHDLASEGRLVHNHVLLVELETGVMTDLVPDANQLVGDAAGSIVVWTDWRADPEGGFLEDGNPDIYAMDLGDRVEIPVSTHPAYQAAPATDGTWVAWLDKRNSPRPNARGAGGVDIYGRRLAGGEEVQLTSSRADEVALAIDNGKLVFRAYESGGDDTALFERPLPE